jgi:hypothetical protein
MKSCKKTSLARFGVTAATKAEWPYPQVKGDGKAGTCRLDTKLHSTQTAVYDEIVDQIASDIAAGKPTKRVEAVFIKGKSWIVDGHHTLAGYRKLGLSAPCFFYKTRGPDQLPPPKLFKCVVGDGR